MEEYSGTRQEALYSMYVSIVRQLIVLLPAAHTSYLKLGNVDYVWFSFVFAKNSLDLTCQSYILER